MKAKLALIRRHPIKSIGGETLDRVTLTAGQVLPHDREWAVLNEAGAPHFEKLQGQWLPKPCFLTGVRIAELQAITGGLDGHMALTHPKHGQISFDPETESEKLIDWLQALLPPDAPKPHGLVQRTEGWTDIFSPHVSILSISSLEDLEARIGQQIGTERWRANLWIDGLPAQAERDLIGETIHIGKVKLRIVEPVTRCHATSANTDTGRRDIDMPAVLKEQFGHQDFGVYAEIIEGGEIATGDEVQI